MSHARQQALLISLCFGIHTQPTSQKLPLPMPHTLLQGQEALCLAADEMAIGPVGKH